MSVSVLYDVKWQDIYWQCVETEAVKVKLKTVCLQDLMKNFKPFFKLADLLDGIRT